MNIRQLPAATGRRWVIEGFRLLRRFPIPMLALTFLYLLVLMVTTLVPLVGPFAPMLVTPTLAVGLMHAVRAADNDRMPTPQMLFAGIRDQHTRAWRPLLLLGLVNVLSTLLALSFASLADDGTLLKIATGQSTPDDPSLKESSLLLASLSFLLIYTPVQMGLWYAPLFVAWHGVAPPKAMFFSFFAVMRNKWAFVQYALAWFVAALIASLIIQLMKAMFGDAPLLISLVLSPMSLIVLTALYCSFWPTYRDAVATGPEDSLEPMPPNEAPRGAADEAPRGAADDTARERPDEAARDDTPVDPSPRSGDGDRRPPAG